MCNYAINIVEEEKVYVALEKSTNLFYTHFINVIIFLNIKLKYISNIANILMLQFPNLHNQQKQASYFFTSHYIKFNHLHQCQSQIYSEQKCSN